MYTLESVYVFVDSCVLFCSGLLVCICCLLLWRLSVKSTTRRERERERERER